VLLTDVLYLYLYWMVQQCETGNVLVSLLLLCVCVCVCVCVWCVCVCVYVCVCPIIRPSLKGSYFMLSYCILLHDPPLVT